MVRFIAFSLLLGVLAASMARPADAQEATPTAPLGEPIDPAGCQFAQRPREEILDLWFPTVQGTPVAATPAAASGVFPTAVPLPLGAPADADTVAAVTQTLRRTMACANAGDYWGLLSLSSDNLIRYYRPDAGSREEARRIVDDLFPPSSEGQRWRLIAITDISVMDDGRVAAALVSEDPLQGTPGPETQLFFLVQERGRWVLDGSAILSVPA
jgi:hypothetical protein